MTTDVTACGAAPGILRLRAVQIGGKTVIADVDRTTPFVAGPASYRTSNAQAEIIIQQTGPGFLPGDILQIEIVVERGAKLTLRSQSATRLFSCAKDESITVETEILVDEGGELRYLPGELIPYRDTRLRQSTRIELGNEAKLAYSEIVTPGRVAMGEAYCYRELDLRLRINRNGIPLLIERALLDPRAKPLTSQGRHGDLLVSGSLAVVGSTAPLPAPIDGKLLRSGIGRRDGLTYLRALGSRTDIVRNHFEDVIASLL